jgi:site-specific recombinase XerD
MLKIMVSRKIDKNRLPPILQRYDDYMSMRGFSQATREFRLYKLLKVHDFMQHERGKGLEQMTTSDVEAYIAKLTQRKDEGEIKARTVQLIASTIKMFAKWLSIREEILDSKEFCKIEEDLKDLPGEKGEDNRVALSKEEEKTVMKKLVDVLLQFIVWLGLNFGLRREEYSKLRIEHVEFDKEQPRLKIELSKGHDKKTRYIPLFPSQINQLKKWLDYRASLNLPHSFLLYNPRDPTKQLKGHDVGYLFQRISKITRVHVYAHRLRYTYAVKLWKHRVDLWTISLALGHDKVETTVRYLKIREQDYFEKYLTMAKDLFH